MKDSTRRAVGSEIRRLRAAHTYTLQDLAERVHGHGYEISAATLSRVERGRAMLPLDAARAVLDVLGVSLSHIEDVIRSASARDHVDLTGRDFDGLVKCGTDLLRAGEYGRAREELEAAHDLLLLESEKRPPPEELGLVLIQKAECYRRLRCHSMSLNAAAEALNLPGISVDLMIKAILLHVAVGSVTGDAYRAEIFAEHAESLLDDVSPESRAYAHGVLGHFHMKYERFEKACRHLELARDLYDRQGPRASALQVRMNLGFSLCMLGHRNVGDRILRDSLAHAHRARHGTLQWNGTYRLARIAECRGDVERAERLFTEASSLARRMDLPGEVFISVFHLWRLATKAGDTQKTRRTASTLRRLLPKVDGSLPEAQKFLASTLTQPSRESRKK